MKLARRLAVLMLFPTMALATGAAVAQQDVRIVNEGGIGDRWMLAEGASPVAPGYPAQFVERGDSVCLAMGYAINPDGSTSDFSLLKSWNSSGGDAEPVPGFLDGFSQAGANALSQWKFAPRPEVDDPQTTYTVATLFFRGRDGIDTATLKQHCRIADLKALVRQNAQRGIHWAQRRDMEAMQRRNASNRAMAESPGTISPPPRP